MDKRTIRNKLIPYLPYELVKKKFEFAPYFGEKAKEAPELYNCYGERVAVMYLKDKGCAHTPYTMSEGRFPRNILWDRFNRGLTTHFYTHSDIFEPLYPCERKFASLRESEAILPADFTMAYEKKDIITQFDALFTHSEKLLNKYSNAKFTPAGTVWYATELNGGKMDSEAFQKKEKNISVVSSNKQMCEMHKYRAAVTKKYIHDKRVDTYGAACGNYIEKKADTLEKYRYSIAIENDVTAFYFTEKLLDCFAAMTVPIYIGAKEIGKFFNTEGMIIVKPEEYDDLDPIINRCCKEDYRERQEAIIDNYQRVQEYLCAEDYIMAHYKYLFE